MSLFRPAIDALQAYVPGEQPPVGARVIKLNTNENPYPPSPAAMAALKRIGTDQLRRYPHPFAIDFQRAVSDVLDIEAERVLVGNGSDDILTMLIRAVTDQDRSVAYPVPTYVLYGTLAAIQDAPTREIPYDETFTLPVDGLAHADAALTVVANPNSPSGTRASNDTLRELAQRVTGVLVIDEAYAGFAATNALELTREFDRVVVLRTLSKSHSLAGLRLGYAIGSPAILSGLVKVKDSYNVDAVACQVGAAAIRDTVYAEETVDRVCETRTRLGALFQRLGFDVWPSEANFVLVRPPGGEAAPLYQLLKDAGILTRYFDMAGMQDKLRVTVGTEAEVDRLEEVLVRQFPRGSGTGHA